MSYTKYHSAWSASDLLSGAAFNQIETQYDEAKADADIHTHDARYYPKATADVTFFSLSYYTGFDADMLDGNHLSDMVAEVMPLGAILIWSGTDANVPTGWGICNGATYSGTVSPDLRDKFVIGAGDTYAVDATGGALSTAITGSFTVASHTITADEFPYHDHAFTDNYASVGSTSGFYFAYAEVGGLTYRTGNTGSSGGGGGHDHTGNSITLSNLNCLPKYYSLYYIIKYA